LGVIGGAIGAAAQAQEESHFFRVPAAPDAAVRAENALDFAATSDWRRVVEELQLLIDNHAAAVLPERYHRGETSQFTLHPGAATWAVDMLIDLPEEARARYRERFAEPARQALAAAVDAQDGRGLAETARRYPLTAGGAAALVALGDLELAQGDAAAARAAWRRASELAPFAAPPGAPELASLQAALERRATASAALFPAASDAGVRLPGAAPDAGPVPLAGADTWQRGDLDLAPFDRTRGAEHYNLFPVLAGDRLLVSSSLRLYCLDAYSSELAWSAGPPSGWDAHRNNSELFNRINRRQLMIAPSAGARVAVAALQIPTALVGDHQYQGIRITGPIPERRLFAYDLATGRELWNHSPPDRWDGESGTFAQRMLVAAPPIVCGSRVIVPCYRMRGRIDYHVACYDLSTGVLLWSTGLISGQSDLNMFGRQDAEFCGAPVAVDGDGVYVLTQLGTVARLDLFSGRIVWESRYEVIPIPKNDGWNDTIRKIVWNNSPPVLTENVVVAAPQDSELLLGLDRASGAVLWSFENGRLPVARIDDKPRTPYDTLLGADEDTVFVGGEVVSALQKPGGLAFKSKSGLREPFRARWSIPASGFSRPRATLGAEEIVLYAEGDRAVVDRAGGRLLERKSDAASESERGNAWIGNGVLFTVGNRKVTAFFDWDVLLARAEAALAADPTGVQPRIDHAALVLRRGRAYVDAGRTPDARPLYARARASLEGVVREARDPRASATLYDVLREQARLFDMDAEPVLAIAALDAALPLAGSPEQLRDTLLAQEELFRVRDETRWKATMARLEREVPELPLPAERTAYGVSWLTAESLVELAPGDLRGVEVPVGLWVLCTRAEASARSHDFAGAHADLHDALARYGKRELALGLTVRDVAGARIARRIELDGRAPYGAFEARARDLFDRAVAKHDALLLAEVGELYPHSDAARRSNALRLDWALAAGDADAAAGLAFGALSPRGALAPDDAAILVRLADLFRARGNEAFERDLLRRLAKEVPSGVSPVERHAGRSYSSLASEHGEGAIAPFPGAAFGTELTRTGVWPGSFHEIGHVALQGGDGESAPELLRILLDRRRVIALGASEPATERWTFELARTPAGPDACVVTAEAGGRVVLGADGAVVALSTETGYVAWELDLDGAEVVAVRVASGIALVLVHSLEPTNGSERYDLRGIEAAGGTPLWTLPLPPRARWLAPVTGAGYAALLAWQWSVPATAAVVDLVRGRIAREIDLGAATNDDSWTGAWLEDGKLIVPYYSPRDDRPSRLAAFELERGTESFTVELAPGDELSAIAAYQGRTILVASSTRTSAGTGDRLLELDVHRGRARTFADLRAGEELIGLSNRTRNALDEPALFSIQVRPGASSVPARMIPLDQRPGWIYQLQVPADRLFFDDVALPALSDGLVAFAYSTKNAENYGREEARIELVDRAGGFHRGTLILSPELSRSEVAVYGLGRAILCLGQGRLGGRSISRLEVLETKR
jgi:outer membrane protein assembly factor BamB